MYQRIKSPKISDIILVQLEEMIVEGTLKPGQRLPAERELAKQFAVSRPSLREAIQQLVAKGVLESRQGGGNYVTEGLGRSFTDPLLELLANHPEAQYDLLEFRHALDGLCAYYAALRSTAIDRENIKNKHQVLQNFHDKKDFAQEVSADVEFHLAIAEAAHNMVLLHMMRSMFDLLKQHITANLQEIYPKAEIRANIHRQHELLMAAIFAGDPERAQAVSHDHFSSVEEAVLEQNKAHTRLKRSLRRTIASPD
ncbi:MAG: transcriptional regulator [Osedax symbiont Rs1]|nr:MAG: transcriptional regulator [Osedax symbiont Rs1]